MEGSEAAPLCTRRSADARCPDGAPRNLHQLSADRAGQFALDLRGSYRLVFAPNHDPLPLLADGGIDRTLVTKIRITEVVDYHGR